MSTSGDTNLFRKAAVDFHSGSSFGDTHKAFPLWLKSCLGVLLLMLISLGVFIPRIPVQVSYAGDIDFSREGLIITPRAPISQKLLTIAVKSESLSIQLRCAGKAAQFLKFRYTSQNELSIIDKVEISREKCAAFLLIRHTNVTEILSTREKN